MNSASEGEMLLPWYVIDRLEPSERKVVDAYLQMHPAEARLQLDLIREEQNVVAEDNEALSGAPAGALARLHQRIEEEDRPAINAAAARKSAIEGLRDLFTLQAPALRYAGIAAAIVIVAQAAVIGGLLVSPDRIGSFETASYPADSAKVEGMRLLLSFEEDASAGAIAMLLKDIGGEIVSGPTADGIYTVKISDQNISKEALNEKIKWLEDRVGIVRFVAEAE